MVRRHYFRGLRPEEREAAAKFKAQRRGGGGGGGQHIMI